MWYLYSLLFCYAVGVLFVSQVANKATENGTPLNDRQTSTLGFIIIILMSIPLFNIIWCVGVVGGIILHKDAYYDRMDELIDRLRRSVY